MNDQNNINNGSLNAYKKAVVTIDGITQVIMLYDTAIASLQQARQAILNKNIEERFNKIAKVYNILNGLSDCLDMDRGGEVAATLRDWYTTTGLRVIRINQTQDIDLCDSCITHIKQMRDAWVDAEKTVKTGAEDKPVETKPVAAPSNDFFKSTSMNLSV